MDEDLVLKIVFDRELYANEKKVYEGMGSVGLGLENDFSFDLPQ